MSTSYPLGSYAFIDEQSNKFSFSFNLEDSEAGFDIGDEKDLDRLKNYLKEILNKKESSMTLNEIKFKAYVNDEGTVNFILSGKGWQYFIPLEVKYEQLIKDIENICDYWPIVNT